MGDNHDNIFDIDSDSDHDPDKDASNIYKTIVADIIYEVVFDAIETVDLENFKKSGNFKKNIARFLNSVHIIGEVIPLTLSSDEDERDY